MSTTHAYEQGVLAAAEAKLTREVRPFDGAYRARLDILEAVSSRAGGFDLAAYRDLVVYAHVLTTGQALKAADSVLEALRSGPIHPSLALTALARPPLAKGAQRASGAYYTDFRLAQMLAAKLPADPRLPLLDPASGTGILLVAAALHVCGLSRPARARFLRECVHAADLSADALRGASLALASLTEDLDAVAAMIPRLRRMDSLLVGCAGWADVAPDGFPVVVGNPPWEKLKLNRHEFASSDGSTGHYGADVCLVHHEIGRLASRRVELAEYVTEVSRDLSLQGTGEPDLYKLFLELSFRLAAPRGHVALLLPAGVIRSQGTERLRQFTLASASQLELTILENRARFFAIDTRFKFIALHAVLGDGGSAAPVVLRHAAGTPTGVEIDGEVRIGRGSLRAIRPDLSIPEVRSPKEWGIFRRMTDAGRRLDDPAAPWRPRIVREVDMTRDRPLFRRQRESDHLAIVEGRMVHQHRFAAKAYVRGTGRRALWAPLAHGAERLVPQFWIAQDRLNGAIKKRAMTTRVGFCDITGQTNERSLLAARIPAGVVCGNKVPTVVFGLDAATDDDRAALGDLWLVIANSFAVDWYARRVLTTTLNYFILLGLAFPVLERASLPAQRLLALARGLDEALLAGDRWAWAYQRAEIDARVFSLYGLGADDARIMLADFPLLDRGQPALPDELSSSITRDLVLAHTARLTGTRDEQAEIRVANARKAGAYAYVPAEWSSPAANCEEEAVYG